MGDEAQKRNTDCVYFLASPLTCKKGADCEYRHSEAARVNPRDCWYWLSGNCLNAGCSFRHPPLDGRPGVSASNSSQVAGGTSSVAATTPTTAASAPSVPSTSTNVSAPPTASKSTVPCFFFSQGYCAKGGKCPFSHGSPTQYRKEATTYQRPQVGEQSANGEGNGVSHAKQQSQDRKSLSQIKANVRAALPSQEAGYIPSNVYKLSASGVPAPPGKRFPGNAGEKVEQTSQVGRAKPVQNANDTTRHAQLVESRTSHAHFLNECVEQFPIGEKGSMKGQLLHLDSGRTIKQGRQPSATYFARTSDTLLSSEMQDPFYEPDSARELHANDLRNHLKRKKNDTAYSSQVRDFRAKEFSKDRLEGGRLASRAVSVAESKDFVPVNNSKRAKQEKESSTFSGPKSLAQIKAEKSKAVTQGDSKATDSMDDCRSEPDPGETKDMVESAPELCDSLLPESGKVFLGDHSGMLGDETTSELKKEIRNVNSELGGTSQNLRPGVGINDSNGLSYDSVPLRISKEAEAADNYSSEVDVASILKERHNLRSEATLGGNKHGYQAVEGTCSEADYVSADELMEDGSEALGNAADPEYNLDYDEEDDFDRKLGSFLS